MTKENNIAQIKQSINKVFWLQNPFDERLAKAIKQRYDLPQVLCELLSAKKIDLLEVEEFLEPKIKTALPNPFELGGVDVAVEHVISGIKNNKKITIFADYDVDGATSAATLKRYFRDIGVDAGIYIPDRILEGYGPNSAALLNLKNSGTDIVIMLDCGTVAFKPLEDAAAVGLDIIVIDHHLGVLEKPKSIAVINPNLLDEKFPHKNLCAAGVTFLFVVALNKKLREYGFFENGFIQEKSIFSVPKILENSFSPQGEGNINHALQANAFIRDQNSKKAIKEPNLLNLLDLTALGTVCDVMSLTGVNRAFVSAGLKVLKQRKNHGLRQICDLAALDQEPSAYHLGFVIGPRINAGGRVGKSDLGARILSSENEDEINVIAQQLEDFNKQRKDIEAQVLQEAIDDLENGKNGFTKNDPIIFAASKNWHQGVIGIVASRLKDLYNRPTAVIAIDDEGKKGKASCRSISGIDFGAEILNARLGGLLLEGGGHAMAGGFSVEASKINELHQFFCQKLSAKVQEVTAQNISNYDIALDLPQLNIELIKHLQKLEPYGVGNSRPKFLLRDVIKVKANLIGKTAEHISAIFSAKSAVGFSGNISAVAFRSANTDLGNLLLDAKYSKPMTLVGTIEINAWMGIEKVQMIIEDIII